MSRLATVALALGLALGTGGCEQRSRLDGSLSTIVSLVYDEARVYRTGNEVAIHFLAVTRPEGEVLEGEEAPAVREDTVFSLSARLGGLELAPGDSLDIDLAEALPSGAQRGTVGRAVQGEPPRSFPAIERGFLRLAGAEEPESGDRLAGEFSITFARGVGFAAGHTAYAHFEATVP